MKKLNLIGRILLFTALPVGVIVGTLLGSQSPTSPQNCRSYAGQAVTGQSVFVDLCSVTPVSARSVNFTYFLGQQRIYGQAHCGEGTWTTFHDGITHSPSSQATANMLDMVCRDGAGGEAWVALVVDPPSNVRSSPNGPIMCVVRSRQTINIYGNASNAGDWYYTDACGSMGLIHHSQIRF
ncbi:hypothetical protein [Spirulina subsalsa]|uniref:hypothetical protein n=1 Tax=Spirulina subsalsa TaxID=54311 RepID=UPI000310D4D9|nr:hypothetical protein [Spirulina subsalsa]